MAENIGAVSIAIKGDDAQYRRSLAKARRATDSASKRMQRSVNNVTKSWTAMRAGVVGVVGALGVMKIANYIRDTTQWADELNNLSGALGISAASIDKLQIAGAKVGVTSSDLERVFRRLSIVLSDSAKAEGFGLLNMSMEEALTTIMKWTDKSKIAKVVGDRGMESVRRLANEYKDFGGVVEFVNKLGIGFNEADIKKLSGLESTFENINQILKHAGARIVLGFSDQIEDLAKKLEEVDWKNFTEKVIKFIDTLTKLIGIIFGLKNIWLGFAAIFVGKIKIMKKAITSIPEGVKLAALVDPEIFAKLDKLISTLKFLDSPIIRVAGKFAIWLTILIAIKDMFVAMWKGANLFTAAVYAAGKAVTDLIGIIDAIPGINLDLTGKWEKFMLGDFEDLPKSTVTEKYIKIIQARARARVKELEAIKKAAKEYKPQPLPPGTEERQRKTFMKHMEWLLLQIEVNKKLEQRLQKKKLPELPIWGKQPYKKGLGDKDWKPPPIHLWWEKFQNQILESTNLVYVLEDAMTDMIMKTVTGTEKMIDAMEHFAKVILNEVLRALIRLWIVQPIVSGLTGVPVEKLAEGGIVHKPTLAVVGESGPEAVVPLDKMGSTSSTPNFNIYLDGRQIRHFVRETFRDDRRRGLAYA